MEKMLQSLLRLHCQAFLEKTYLRNSALNPRIVLRSSPRLLHPNAARERAAQVLFNRSHPQFAPAVFFPSPPFPPQSGLFSLYLKVFFF